MKKVFCLYRTKDFTEADRIERNRQKTLCQQFIDESEWLLTSEFWQKENNVMDAPPPEDLLPLLCWSAEHRLFDILLVSEFDRIGRFPMECSTAAAFFERNNVEVWSADHGHIGRWLQSIIAHFPEKQLCNSCCTICPALPKYIGLGIFYCCGSYQCKVR